MLGIDRHYTQDLDIHDSSGSGSGGSVHTPSTVHTAIISILPPTTASTANFPLDIFPSPPKSYNELGPLRSRPSTPEHHYETTSNRNSTHRHRHRHVNGRSRRRYSEPTGSSSREALIEQRRFTMSFDIVLAPSKTGTSGNENGIQERVVRVGFPQKRRSSIGSTSVNSLSLQCGKTGGDCLRGERERARVGEWQEKGEDVSNPKNEGRVGKEQDGARVCVYDFIKKEDKVQEESEFSAPLSSPSLPKQNLPTVLSTATTHTPLWPSLPSGPSSPNSNFTSYTRQQDILPPGRVLSGFSDINYSSCSFSVDDHDHEQEDVSGVKVDISPTIPIIQLRPDIESAVGILHRPRPIPPRNRARPAPLPLSLSLKTLPPIPSTPDISPIIPLSSPIQASKTTSAINILSAGSDCVPTQSVIGNHKESFSAPTRPIHEGEQGNKESETYQTRTKPCFEKTTSLPSTRNLPLAEIARVVSPSNVNQYHPSTRAKGIGASTIDSSSLLVSGSTIEITVPILASPISIYSQHTSSSSPASMPLTLNRSHQDWEQQGE